jgi:uncharacterized protein YbjT (DUF2867 family)
MTFLVLGATGTQGSSVVRHLLGRNAAVRALTRNAGKHAASDLRARGVEVVEGDLSEPGTLVKAFEGVDGVFSVQDFYAPGVGLSGEIAQGRTVIAMAKSAGVRHVVQSTMGDGNKPGGPEHFISKATIERDLKASGITHTLLGTVWFLDNLINPKMKPSLTFPILSGSLFPATPFHMLAVDDLGWMAAEALTNPAKWAGRKINLAGDVMTVTEMKRQWFDVTGTRPKSWKIPAFIFRRLAPEFAAQLAWHNQVNFAFGTEALRAVRPQASGFSEFVRSKGLQGL